jgi:PiT family inorganic phosphate transporter
MGAGLGRKGGVVRWSTATRMFVAWGLTLPAAALVGALAEYVTGLGAWGTGLVAVLLIGSSAAIWKLSRREVVDHTNVNEAEEPAGVITTAIAAVTPPPAGTVAEDLTATIPAQASPATAAAAAVPPTAMAAPATAADAAVPPTATTV